MYTLMPSQVVLDTKSVVANRDTLRTIRDMENWQDRARSVMKERGVTQESLTRVLGVSTRGAVGHYLSGRREPTIKQLNDLADHLEVDFSWLVSGKGVKQSVIGELCKQQGRELRQAGDEGLSDTEVYRRRETEVVQQDMEEGWRRMSLDEKEALIESDSVHPTTEDSHKKFEKRADEIEFFGHMDAWDSKTPLDEDEVELPLFREIELAAGAGATQVIENQGAKLRFAKSTLRRAGVPVEAAACAFVRGNSMEPVMPDGTCVGVNTADKAIKDGEIYAIDHGGMLRVKYLHRRPGGGVKIVSQNAGEHPVEEVTADDMAAGVRVIGRVFWWSVLR